MLKRCFLSLSLLCLKALSLWGLKNKAPPAQHGILAGPRPCPNFLHLLIFSLSTPSPRPTADRPPHLTHRSLMGKDHLHLLHTVPSPSSTSAPGLHPASLSVREHFPYQLLREVVKSALRFQVRPGDPISALPAPPIQLTILCVCVPIYSPPSSSRNCVWLPPTSLPPPQHQAQALAYCRYSINAHRIVFKSLKSKTVSSLFGFSALSIPGIAF